MGCTISPVLFVMAMEVILKATEGIVDPANLDNRKWLDTVITATEGHLVANKCGLEGKFKVWCLLFMPIPKLLWPSLVYEICSTTVEAIEAKINKWLGVPPGLTGVAMYCHKAKLRLPMKFILEE
ncbi:hypothetical protein RRG08_000366 [Elysia crispata]|uniref:Reverse transcriptase domain-containing protein n=1 Tax=Elysia crispata TaxID=231223 RepID=A0AAE1DQR1_9GAST|nr:hypothetical protein RRG08_000366 [Elysia crispata]